MSEVSIHVDVINHWLNKEVYVPPTARDFAKGLLKIDMPDIVKTMKESKQVLDC